MHYRTIRIDLLIKRRTQFYHLIVSKCNKYHWNPNFITTEFSSNVHGIICNVENYRMVYRNNDLGQKTVSHTVCVCVCVCVCLCVLFLVAT